MICKNISANDKGQLLFAGQNTVELAREYGTPVYLMDEDLIRENCRTYIKAFKELFGGDSKVLYASKANSFKRIYEIMREEGMGIDVVSSGEIHTALLSGFDMADAFFHGNNKTDWDIEFAMDSKVGYFVVDNEEEISVIQQKAKDRGIKQKVLLRITPGIDTHTFEAVNTGMVDSKFGSAIETGQAIEITRHTLEQPNVELAGFHCHVGSQVFAEDVFERSAVIMLEFIADVKKEFGFSAGMLNLGGGYGVRYTDADPTLDVASKIGDVAREVKAACERLGLVQPAILMEPGRSIVGAAGMTLYTVGTVKNIPGYKNYVSVDGSMSDHPRFALYGSKYTVLPAGKMDEDRDLHCSLVGRCCESGDIIYDKVDLPASTGRGDIVAVCTTGAYHYSMASNYNRLGRPPIVMLKSQNESYVAVKRESFEDLTRNDL